jgi:hypothetical protein
VNLGCGFETRKNLPHGMADMECPWMQEPWDSEATSGGNTKNPPPAVKPVAEMGLPLGDG